MLGLLWIIITVFALGLATICIGNDHPFTAYGLVVVAMLTSAMALWG